MSDSSIVSSPYETLDRDRKEIRLLLLKAGSGSGPLRCELQQAFLTKASKPEYETISYCWGNKEGISETYVHDSVVRIPLNASAALCRMRLDDSDRLLWIDTLCINQEDDAKRGHQVSLMYEIFTGTVRHLVWLGEDDGSTEEALGVMNEILLDARDETNDFVHFATTIKDQAGSLQVSSRKLELARDPKPLVKLFDHAWFRRLWLVQEVTLAPSNICFCGDYEIPLDDVMRTAAWLHYKRRFFPHSIDHRSGFYFSGFLFDIADQQFGSCNPFSHQDIQLHSLLTSFQQFDTSDSRDHVYGLLGLPGLSAIKRDT